MTPRAPLHWARTVILMAATLLTLGLATERASARTMDTHFANESLMPNDALMSLNGGYQDDGNLVLHRLADMQALWSSRTAGNPGAFAVMQGDGNLVVYLDGKPLFNTRTQGNPQAQSGSIRGDAR